MKFLYCIVDSIAGTGMNRFLPFPLATCPIISVRVADSLPVKNSRTSSLPVFPRLPLFLLAFVTFDVLALDFLAFDFFLPRFFFFTPARMVKKLN